MFHFTEFTETPNFDIKNLNRQTAGAKIRTSKGIQPRLFVKVQKKN